ncbi:hypothetical protein CDES_00950 [Corynebacterium deserti GIMN1.010]|uniref:Secreted protein n=2 Tax=Corynebacterium TaxID=1716 RepID=A0A0M4CVI5_9CORY|nr:hypothetical protein CDES_00950 [Corynebacterium deserti GIMN1.010]
MAVALILLILPTLFNLVTPDKNNSYKQLEISQMGIDWKLPIVTESNAPVMCEETSDDITMVYWDCNGDTTVSTMVVENMEDPSNTLRRMVKATLVTEVDESLEAVSSDDGRAYALYVPAEQYDAYWSLPIVALALKGQGDYENLTLLAVINGESLEYYSTHIWSSMAKNRGESWQQEFPLQLEDDPWQSDSLDDPFQDFPWEELPWDQTPEQAPDQAPGQELPDLDSLFEQYPELFDPSSLPPVVEGESL